MKLLNLMYLARRIADMSCQVIVADDSISQPDCYCISALDCPILNGISLRGIGYSGLE